ncbi:hypothetical protein D3C72_2555720 [compost metagenome]
MGPQTALVHLLKMIGSLGTAMPASAAWSEKLRPMQMNLPICPTQGPIRGVPGTNGRLA